MTTMIPGFDMTLLTRKENHALLDKLPEPKIMFAYFLMCTEIPRPSGSLTQIRERICAIGRAHQLDVEVDSAGNVRIRKAATPGHEKALKVLLQAHMDMVPTKLSELVHDFTKDPVQPYLEGDSLKARGTTLGGDDGVGVAACLAALTQPGLVHGPLECLFTVDEETTLYGAEHVAPAPYIQASACINVDSEDEHAVCIGSAGGLEKRLCVPVSREPSWASKSSQYSLLNVTVDGLLGGHTGCDIHLGRANAVQVMAKLLSAAVENKIDLRLLAIKGGNASNAIPHECSAQVYVRTEQQTAFDKCVQAMFASLKHEYRISESKVPEGGVSAKTSGDAAPALPPPAMFCSTGVHEHKQATPPAPLDAACTQKVLDFIVVAPHGPLRMSAEVSGDVETSVACSLLSLPAVPEHGKEDELSLGFLARSSSDAQLMEVGRRLDGLGRLAGSKPSPKLSFFSGWQPNSRSVLLTQCCAAHKELFGTAPRVYSVHAGLECGMLQGKYPHMQCISIGPQVTGAHTTEETLKVSSVAPFYAWTMRTLQLLTTVPESPVPGAH